MSSRLVAVQYARPLAAQRLLSSYLGIVHLLLDALAVGYVLGAVVVLLLDALDDRAVRHARGLTGRRLVLLIDADMLLDLLLLELRN